MSEPSFSPDKFDAQFQRILEATGCKTQVELADILEVRQSAISDAKRRMTIPSNWLETLHKKQGLHVVKTVEFRPLEECSLRDIIRELVRRIWQEPDYGEARKLVSHHVQAIRRKMNLEKDSGIYLRCIREVGYSLELR